MGLVPRPSALFPRTLIIIHLAFQACTFLMFIGVPSLTPLLWKNRSRPVVVTLPVRRAVMQVG